MIDNKFLSSPEDSRDYIFEDLFTDNVNIPVEYDPRKNLLPVRNQEMQGSCVGMACAAIKEVQESKQVGFTDYFSPQFVYNLRVNQPDQGMYPRNAFQILRNIGILPEENYPYDKIQKPEEMDAGQLKEASDYKIKSYARVKTIEGVKKAVLVNGAVMLTVTVFSNADPIWKVRNTNSVAIGGHAMIIVGWSVGGFIVRNSWGNMFGNDKNGYCFLPYSDWEYVGELWTVFDSDSKPEPMFSKWYWKFWRGLKNIKKNLDSLFYLASVGFLVGLGIGIKDLHGFLLSAIILVGVSVFAAIKKLYLPKV